MVKRAGKKAGLPFQCHAHMIRHATGYKLANAGKDTRSIQGYLGHKDIRHTVRYTELSPTRFRISGPTERETAMMLKSIYLVLALVALTATSVRAEVPPSFTGSGTPSTRNALMAMMLTLRLGRPA